MGLGLELGLGLRHNTITAAKAPGSICAVMVSKLGAAITAAALQLCLANAVVRWPSGIVSSLSHWLRTACIPASKLGCVQIRQEVVGHVQVYKAQVGDKEVAVKAINQQHINPSLTPQKALYALQKVPALQLCIKSQTHMFCAFCSMLCVNNKPKLSSPPTPVPPLSMYHPCPKPHSVSCTW